MFVHLLLIFLPALNSTFHLLIVLNGSIFSPHTSCRTLKMSGNDLPISLSFIYALPPTASDMVSCSVVSYFRDETSTSYKVTESN